MADLTKLCINGDCSDVSGGGASYTAGTNIDITGNVISAPDVYSKTEADTELAKKQNKLTAGDGITINASTGRISASMNPANTYTKTETDTNFQKKLTAGDNIQISASNVISATDTTYTAGTGVSISASKVISAAMNPTNTYTKTETDNAFQKKLTAGDNVQISASNVISATDTTYTAGTGVSISASKVISADRNASNTYTKTEVDNLLTNKQAKLTAGTNVQISASNVISATDTKYTAGTGIGISSSNVITADRNATNTYTKTEVDTALANKQAKLTAGTNITIDSNNVISASGSGASYTAGSGISINASNVISAERNSTNTYTKTEVDNAFQKKLTAGDNVQISTAGVISATDTTYTAGANVQISSANVISATDTKYTAASAAPLMDGTAAVGTSAKYAREDHVHPSDTTKVDKETGKGLSTNDFTTALLNKLNGIAAGAEVNVQSDWNVTDTTSDAFIKNKPTNLLNTTNLEDDFLQTTAGINALDAAAGKRFYDLVQSYIAMTARDYNTGVVGGLQSIAYDADKVDAGGNWTMRKNIHTDTDSDSLTAAIYNRYGSEGTWQLFSYAFGPNAQFQIGFPYEDVEALFWRTKIWWGSSSWQPWRSLDGTHLNWTDASITYSSYVTQHTVQMERRGETAFLSGFFRVASGTPVDTTLFTLPAKFRPIAQWTMVAQIPSGAAINTARVLLINTDGTVVIHNGSAPSESTYFRFSVSYPVTPR